MRRSSSPNSGRSFEALRTPELVPYGFGQEVAMPRVTPILREPEELYGAVVKTLEMSAPLTSGESWTPLRDPLFECLRRLGTTSGFSVWDYRVGGYLYDIAWTYEPSDASEYWLELAGEIELSDPSLPATWDDFYKVLDAKARLKVFVAGLQVRLDVERLCGEIDWGVTHQRFRLPEERLIAVVLDYDPTQDLYIHRARLFDGNGPLKDWRNGWEQLRVKA
jgi:hypothetical protein